MLNGQSRSVPDGVSVSGLLEHLDLDSRRVAVELNLDIVPRADYSARSLRDGDAVEIVSFVGGG